MTKWHYKNSENYKRRFCAVRYSAFVPCATYVARSHLVRHSERNGTA